jgi:hypothetical protein
MWRYINYGKEGERRDSSLNTLPACAFLGIDNLNPSLQKFLTQPISLVPTLVAPGFNSGFQESAGIFIQLRL